MISSTPVKRGSISNLKFNAKVPVHLPSYMDLMLSLFFCQRAQCAHTLFFVVVVFVLMCLPWLSSGCSSLVCYAVYISVKAASSSCFF